MSWLRLSLGLMVLSIPSFSSARFTYVPIIISQRTVWNVESDTPFAIWEASSSSAPGAEVSVDKKDDIVDRASLLPQAVYIVDQDFYGNGGMLLKKGAPVIKMAGSGGEWYCTWRYGAYAKAPTSAVQEKRELCLRAEPNRPVSDATLELSLYPEMLTILPSVIPRHVKGFNPVGLQIAEQSLLPSRSELEIHASWQSANGGSVCLNYTMNPLFSPKHCFGPVEQSLEMMGGRYTLLSIGADGTAKIRIDRAINVSDIRPRPRGH